MSKTPRELLAEQQEMMPSTMPVAPSATISASLTESHSNAVKFSAKLLVSSASEKSESRSASGDNRCHLTRVPFDAIAPIMACLEPIEISHLRSTCRHMVAAFNVAVEMEYFIEFAGCLDGDAISIDGSGDSYQLHTIESQVHRWFPIALGASSHAFPAESCPRSLSILIGRYFGGFGFMPNLESIRYRARPNSRFMYFLHEAQSLKTADIDVVDKLDMNLNPSLFGDCPNLENVRLGRCPMAPNFFKGCSSLRNIDLSELRNNRSIDSGFLSDSGIRSIDLSHFTEVTEIQGQLMHIGHHFAAECTQLVEVNLEGLVSLKSIGDNALCQCPALKTVRLGCMPALTLVGRNFLCGCSSLVEIDLSGWTNVQCVGEGFLAGCELIETIDISNWSQLRTIGGNFAADCYQLKTLKLPTPWPSLCSIGSHFAASCDSLQRVDFPEMDGLTSIEGNFMVLCGSLEEVSFASCPALADVKGLWFEGCSSLSRIVVRTTEDLEGIRPAVPVAIDIILVE